MPQPSCMCTVLLKLAKDSKPWGQCTGLLNIEFLTAGPLPVLIIQYTYTKVVACYYDTHIYFSDLIKTNHNPETEPLCGGCVTPY